MTFRKRMIAPWLLIWPLAMASTWSPSAEVEQAVAEHIPWSGYWWPISKGELLAPLGKYDALTGSRSMWWELENHPPGPQASPWHGYCHGWAAAAVIEAEPQVARWATSSSLTEPVPLTVADQKGWITACHAYDPATQYGDRYGDGTGAEDPLDMAPDVLWGLLRQFIQNARRPLVFDLDAGPEVWNYPVFAYRVEHEAMGRGWRTARLHLWAADDAVPPDYVGTMPYLQSYTFVFFPSGDGIAPGTARWTGQSVSNHPDFAWYPSATVPQNSELDHGTVQSLIGTGRVPSPTPSDLASPATDPQLRAWLRNDMAAPPGDETPLASPISPLELVAAIAEQTSHFGLDLSISPLGKVRWPVGQRFHLMGSSEQPGYLSAIHVDPTGRLSLLYPAPGEFCRIDAVRSFRVPNQQQGDFLIQGPPGNHRIKILVTKRPLILTGLDRVHGIEPESNGPLNDDEGRIWKGCGFRFLPSQATHLKALLTDYAQGEDLTSERLDRTDAVAILSPFAQDEITYYVESHGGERNQP